DNCFVFQAEDGIRDDLVTGVQTCALPFSRSSSAAIRNFPPAITIIPMRACFVALSIVGFAGGECTFFATTGGRTTLITTASKTEIGRASCRERVMGMGISQ